MQSLLLRDVLMRAYPSAVCQRPIHDLDQTAARGLDDCLSVLSLRNVAQNRGTIISRIANEAAGLCSMRNKVAECAPWFYYVPRQPIHVDVAFVDHHDPRRCIEQ